MRNSATLPNSGIFRPTEEKKRPNSGSVGEFVCRQDFLEYRGATHRRDIMPAPYETHRAQLKAILLAWGMPEDNAETTADILGWADLHGVDSHGISMLPGYDRLRRSGRANMAARPRIIKETPVSALIDGDGGLGHVPARF